MSSFAPNSKRVLGIDPTPRGFGFVVLEGPTALIDWGVKSTRRNKGVNTLNKVSDMIRQYRPDVIILEDCTGADSRRCERVELLIQSIQKLMAKIGVKCRTFSPSRIRKVFAPLGAETKHQIARAIADQLPQLSPSVPPYRKPWMSEDYRMAFFDAAALALTYFNTRPRSDTRSADYSS
jgi:Holliday junction resolvasome RuvABC endonuclease subunit